jgi:hypothetical protein
MNAPRSEFSAQPIREPSPAGFRFNITSGLPVRFSPPPDGTKSELSPWLIAAGTKRDGEGLPISLMEILNPRLEFTGYGRLPV